MCLNEHVKIFSKQMYIFRDMHNKFTLVKSKRRARQKEKIIPVVSSEPETDPLLVNKLSRKLNEILQNLEREHFAKDLLTDIQSVLKKLNRSEVDLILCYGLGKFSESSCSLHQLAILIFLKGNFKSDIQIFDPVFDVVEVEFLKGLDICVIEDNEEGKRVVDEDRVTLVFLPHCPNQLVNNFLWANWNPNLRNCIILSNSFSKIIEKNTKKSIAHSARYISKCFDFCEETPVGDTYDYPNVFNDISIHSFPELDLESAAFESPAEEPVYAEDTEFITKEKDQKSK